MKKGFTLIELLAVIIIMAVIALIATPIVLNVVDNAKEEANKNSVRGYADSVRLSYAEEILNNTGRPLKELATEKTQGDEVSCEYVKYDKKSGILLHSCKVNNNGNYCYINGYVYEDGTEECKNIISLIMSENIPYNTPNIYVVSQMPDGYEYSQSKEISVEYPSLKVIDKENYYIRSSETIEIETIGKCGSDELPSNCSSESSNSIEANTWYQVSGNITFTTNKNLSIEAIIGADNEYGSKKTYEEKKIDTTEPSVSIEGISTTSNKIIVNAKCEDTESGVSKIEYSIDGNNYQESNVFDNLLSTNTYKVKVRCTNGSGINKEESSEETSLSEIIKPTIEQYSQIPNDSEYAQKRVIRITYNGTGVESPRYYYSLDNSTWTETTETTKDIEFTSNGYLYAKTEDASGNVANAAVYTVSNIDTNAPTISVTVSGKTATLTLGDKEQLSGYGVNQSTGTQPGWTVVSGTSASKTWTASAAGNYVAWVKDTTGRTAYAQFTIASTAFFTSKDFSYTGGVQSFTVPATGTYKLEVWGAQGGYGAAAYHSRGGYGGYSYGNISLTKGQQLFVVVGGQGNSGGYNGGGASYKFTNGGGATHIAKTTNRGELKNYASYKSEILIVAGGGGGGGWYGGGQAWASGDTLSGGGGGSGYIGGVTGGSMQNGVRSSHGYARITLVN